MFRLIIRSVVLQEATAQLVRLSRGADRQRDQLHGISEFRVTFAATCVEVPSLSALELANPFYFGLDGLVCVAVVMIIVFLATSTHRSARRCPRCHEVNREPAVYCAQCGARLPGR